VCLCEHEPTTQSQLPELHAAVVVQDRLYACNALMVMLHVNARQHVETCVHVRCITVGTLAARAKSTREPPADHTSSRLHRPWRLLKKTAGGVCVCARVVSTCTKWSNLKRTATAPTSWRGTTCFGPQFVVMPSARLAEFRQSCTGKTLRRATRRCATVGGRLYARNGAWGVGRGYGPYFL